MIRRNGWVFAIVIAIWTAYLALTLATPITESSRELGINEVNLALIRVTIAVPYLVAWLAAAYGGLTLIAVSDKIAQREDSAGYRRIAAGIFVLAGSLIATSLIGAILSYLSPGERRTPSATIIVNYIHVFAPLIGLSLILAGSGRLRRGSVQLSWGWSAAGAAGLALFAVLYVWLIFTNPTRTVSADPRLAATYYLPDAAIVMTIVLPFLAACGIGLLGVLRIARFYRGLTGDLYQRAARHLMNGVLFVILGSILLQALLSLGSERLFGIGLGWLLAVIYAFIAVQTAGFIFVSLGAKKLSIIENVMKRYETGAAGEGRSSAS